jgi:hypothetical protein
MIEPEEPPEFQIERLVRAHLDRESERVDPRPLFERIVRDLPAAAAPPPPTVVRHRRATAFWRWAGVAAMAASVIACATLAWRWDRPALARGETVVREARRVHSMPIDRCYLVEVRRESSIVAELSPTTPQVRMTRLWSRGDRFWVESARPDQRWAWGRDEANRFWIAFGPHTALRMEAEEVPYWLNIYCDLHSMNVEPTLGEVLSRFDLTRESGAGDSSSSTIRILARGRDEPREFPTIQTIELEIDAETRVIRRMVVRRVLNGQPFATVTFSLAETDALDPANYQLEGHLTDPSEIFTRDHMPQRRKDLLSRWFGSRPGRWYQPIEPGR